MKWLVTIWTGNDVKVGVALSVALYFNIINVELTTVIITKKTINARSLEGENWEIKAVYDAD
jgi:hypothetical protein